MQHIHLSPSFFLPVRTLLQRGIVLLAAVLLAACATVSPHKVLESSAKPTDQEGYVVGVFSGKGQGFGFGLVNNDTGKTYFFPFFESVILNLEKTETMRMIALPLGNYTLDHWASYDELTHHTVVKQNLAEGEKAFHFSIQPGHIVFMGRYTVEQEAKVDHITSTATLTTTAFKIKPKEISKLEFSSQLKQYYPNFVNQPIDID